MTYSARTDCVDGDCVVDMTYSARTDCVDGDCAADTMLQPKNQLQFATFITTLYSLCTFFNSIVLCK